MKKYKIFRIATIPVAIYKLLNGQISFLNSYFEVKCICSKEKYFEELQATENVPVLDVTIKREISIFHDILAILKLYLIFQREKPHIIHSHTPKAGLVTMVAGFLARVPIRIHTFTGIRFETTHGFFRKLLIFIDKVICLCATHIVPEGEGVKKTLQDNHITKKTLKIIHNGNINGINLDYFNKDTMATKTLMDLRNHLRINDNDFIFSFVGRIVQDKGITELITAFLKIHDAYPNTKLILVGPFEMNSNAVPMHIQKTIQTHSGIISVGLQQDIRPYLAISNLFVFPSYREGFPNVLLQAGAMGLPAIVTNISGNNEIIIQNHNGIIIPPRDSHSLYSSMQLLIEDINFLNHLSSNARNNVFAKYNNQDIWNETLLFYNELILEYQIQK